MIPTSKNEPNPALDSAVGTLKRYINDLSLVLTELEKINTSRIASSSANEQELREECYLRIVYGRQLKQWIENYGR